MTLLLSADPVTIECFHSEFDAYRYQTLLNVTLVLVCMSGYHVHNCISLQGIRHICMTHLHDESCKGPLDSSHGVQHRGL